MARRSWPIAVNPVSGALTWDAELSTTLLPVSVNHQANAVAWTSGATTDKWPVSVTLAGELSYGGTEAFDPLTGVTWAAAYWASDPSWVPPADGARATSVRDGSGNGLTLTSGLGPTFQSSKAALSGRPCLDFAANASEALLSPSFTMNQTFSIVMVGLWPNNANNVPLSSISSNNIQWFQGAPNDPYFYAGTVLAFGAATLDGTSKLSYAVFAGAASKRGHGTDADTGVNLGALNLPSGIQLGRLGTSTAPFTGSIAFVGVFTGDVTADANWPAFKTWASSFYGAAVAP